MKLLKLAFLTVMVGMLATAGTGCKKKTLPGGAPEITGGVQAPGNTETRTDDPLNPRATGGIIPVHNIPGWPEGTDATIVYFQFDKCEVQATEQPKVETLAGILKKFPTYVVRVEGNCDERGSAEYNRGLGQRRAETVRDYLVKLGVEESRIDTLSNGLEKPAVKDAKSDAEHAKNRRDEFVIGTREK